MMAATAREERMAQRMRGARRHNVGDISFGFVLPNLTDSGDNPAATTPSANTSTSANAATAATAATAAAAIPNTSAKRRRLDSEVLAAGSGNATVPRNAWRLQQQEDAQDQKMPAAATSMAPPPRPVTRKQSLLPSALPHRQGQDKPQQGAHVAGGGDDELRVRTDPYGAQSPDLVDSHQQQQRQSHQAGSRGSKATPAVAPTPPPSRPSPQQGQSQVRSARSRGRVSLEPRSARLQSYAADIEGMDEGEDEISAILISDPVQPLTTPVAVTAAGSTRKTARSARVPSSVEQTVGPGPEGEVAAESGRRGRRRARGLDAAPATDPSVNSTVTPVAADKVTGKNRGRQRKSSAAAPLGSREPRHSDGQDEISPDKDAESERRVGRLRKRKANEMTTAAPMDEAPAGVKRRRSSRIAASTAADTSEVVEEPSVAEEIDDAEAARRLGGRHRRRTRASSATEPEEGNTTLELERNLEQELADTRPTRRRRRKETRHPARPSPVKQRQPKTAQAAPPRRSAQTATLDAVYEVGRDDEEADELFRAIPITVQRFVTSTSSRRRSSQQQDDEGEPDPLALDQAALPPKPDGANVVDVLAQLCDEVMAARLARLEERLAAAPDKGARKTLRIKYRAVMAFRSEIMGRLLEHTIALDNLASLAKQARTLHRERQRLRTEVLRLRREREQVTLRLDAVRARHARVSSRARTTLDLSRRMHDVEAVVERGGTVNTATAAEARRAAELPNLEISAARVAAMVGTGTSTTTQGGRGWLGEVKAFNAFLERAARALEARAWMVDRGLSKTNRDET